MPTPHTRLSIPTMALTLLLTLYLPGACSKSSMDSAEDHHEVRKSPHHSKQPQGPLRTVRTTSDAQSTQIVMPLRVFTAPVDVIRWGRVYRENTYLLYNATSRDGVIIDPGAKSPKLEKEILRTKTKVLAILNTHGHFDHVGANQLYRTKYGVSVYGHRADRHFYTGANARHKPDRYIRGTEQLSFGSLSIQVIHTPGHSRGSLFFRCGSHLFSGDTLFRGSVGRTFGDKRLTGAQKMKLQLHHIKTRVLPLPGALTLYPGHGPASTLGHEARTNPYLVGHR